MLSSVETSVGYPGPLLHSPVIAPWPLATPPHPTKDDGGGAHLSLRGKGVDARFKKAQAVWFGGSRNEIPALLRREAIGYNLTGQGSTQGYPSTPQGRAPTPALRWPFQSMLLTFQMRSNMNLTALAPLRQGVRESGFSEAPITSLTDTHRV